MKSLMWTWELAWLSATGGLVTSFNIVWFFCRRDNTPVRVLLLLLFRHAQGTPRYGSALPRFPWWLSRMMSGICWPSIRDNHHGNRGRADPYFLWRGVRCLSHGLSARRARRTKSRGPKGPQLEVGAWRAPRLLVSNIANLFSRCII